MASSSSRPSNQGKKQHVGSKSKDMEEIVKYMSNLPSYLERGKPIQDKALNFGVLEWGRLEQWQYHHHKQGVNRTNKHAPSGSISSNKPTLLRSYLNIPPDHSSEKKTTHQSRTKPASSLSKGKMKLQDELVNEIQDSSYGNKAVDINGEKSEEIHSDLKNDIPTENETVNKKKSQKINPRRRHFSFSMSCKSEATKSIESPPAVQNAPKDSKLKQNVKMDVGNYSSSSSRKQALFQMTVKNGRPLFTFAVDGENKEVVAATVRSLAAKDDTNSWIYTFFTVHELKKKKSGWLQHGIKDKDSGYLPNVTAQMKVSNPSTTNREFVLSSVESCQPDHQILDVQLEHEQAAIVVRFLTNEDDQDCFSMTVILPSGHHGVTRKGEPSPLIQRWRSGGRCDCDGWDVGCRLNVLTNKIQYNRRSNPSESFDLFLQGDVINERSFFNLSPVKEGIFSVDYNSCLPLVHAFSICISVVECRKSSGRTELRTYVAKQVDDDVDPVIYASLPPVSPVGRV